MRHRQIAVDVERAFERLLAACQIGARSPGVAELANQPITPAELRPRRREPGIAIDRAAIQVERRFPAGDLLLRLIPAEIELVCFAIGGRGAIDSTLLARRQRD